LKLLKENINNARNAFEKFNEVATQTHKSYQEIITNPTSKRGDTRITQQCQTAINNLATIYINGSCPTYYLQYFNPLTNANDRQTAVTNFCTNCAKPFSDAVSSVVQNCNLTDFDAAVARAAGFYPRFFCSQDSGKYCVNVLNDVVTQIPTDINNINNDVLAKVCTPCVFIALNVLQQGNLVAPAVYFKSVLVLKGVCVKVDNKYCFPILRDQFNVALQIGVKLNSSGADVSASDFQKVLDLFCSPCYRKVTINLALSNGFTALVALRSLGSLGALCRKNAAREYCLIKIYNIAKQYLVQGAKVPCDNFFGNGNTTCSDDCKSLVRNFVNQGGCCWAVLADAISGFGPGSNDPKKSDFYKAIKTCVPDLTIPDPCVSVAKAVIKITYTNLVLDYINANNQIFITAFLADLSLAIGGYDSADATITTNKRAGTVTVTSNVQTSGTLGSTLTFSDGTCNSVCGAIPAQDPAVNVVVSSQTSGLSITSSSSIVSISFALLFILSLFLF
jgi:hypothetical protein